MTHILNYGLMNGYLESNSGCFSISDCCCAPYVFMHRQRIHVRRVTHYFLTNGRCTNTSAAIVNGICSNNFMLLIQQLMEDATAKINMGRPEKPFETTRQGAPFHISLEMHRDYPKHFSSCASYDVYAFGALLWVLCEGSGLRRPQAYDNYCTVEAMKIAVEKNIFPERPSGATDACWKLMTKCWKQRHVVTIQDVLSEMTRIYTAV